MTARRSPKKTSNKNITPRIIKEAMTCKCLAHVAQISGVNKSSITYRREKLGLLDTPFGEFTEDQMRLLLSPKKRKSPLKKVHISEDMIRSYEQGNSLQVVADEFGISASTLKRRLKVLGKIRNSKEAYIIALNAGRHVTSKIAA
ncbi:hypothetical protein L1267_17000 [Pseudoalteromonas sp. OFAV1]|uniref:hypothetical protein n=1 Tax=Pseudoalteromonas sp. OFAV1 TaxID=2908892 RepID=UPI001F41AE10|nr:hypothetical protein [Pseudoalteromonas sp. OFAV1]MCF2902076.1 hypothetical protein [Pseudoalteromonas sp. OFAV1]